MQRLPVALARRRPEGPGQGPGCQTITWCLRAPWWPCPRKGCFVIQGHIISLLTLRPSLQTPRPVLYPMSGHYQKNLNVQKYSFAGKRIQD